MLWVFVRAACSLRQLCIAGAIASALMLAGSSTALAAGQWSLPDPLDPTIGARAVSCASASFCVAVGSAWSFGSAAAYENGRGAKRI